MQWRDSLTAPILGKYFTWSLLWIVRAATYAGRSFCCEASGLPGEVETLLLAVAGSELMCCRSTSRT